MQKASSNWSKLLLASGDHDRLFGFMAEHRGKGDGAEGSDESSIEISKAKKPL